jgi:hypothetical protein
VAEAMAVSVAQDVGQAGRRTGAQALHEVVVHVGVVPVRCETVVDGDEGAAHGVRQQGVDQQHPLLEPALLEDGPQPVRPSGDGGHGGRIEAGGRLHVLVDHGLESGPCGRCVDQGGSVCGRHGSVMVEVHWTMTASWTHERQRC